MKSLLNKAHHIDAFKFMDDLPDDCVDLIICDGPYGLSKADWDNITNIQHYNLQLIIYFSRILKYGGSVYLFGKPDCIDKIDYSPHLQLNSKIVWYCPASLAQGRTSYTNNYDLIVYFSKGPAKTFNLEDIRVPQLTELTHRKRVEKVPSVKSGKFGNTKYNENGKNPGDVWGDIKQLTYRSKELISKELHTIQKPVALIERLVKASSNKGDLVFSPFMGTGTDAVVCQKLGRKWVGCEIDEDNIKIINRRLK